MPEPTEDCPHLLHDPILVSRIHDVLDRAGYTQARILQLLSISELPTSRQRGRKLPLFLWRSRGGSPLETLVRLFLFQQTVARESARVALAPMRLEEWVESGLLRVCQDEVWATVELFPYQDLVAAADWPRRPQTGWDEVMGIASTSRLLASMTIRSHAVQSLDLGTGCGILALLAASHSDRVVAVDLNPRAVEMARFNAQLNGRSNITCLEGSLFEPVSGQAFDLIVCNPPFLITPRHDYLHSHSGLPVDHLCRDIVRTAPAHLREGGYCQLLCNWPVRAGQPWRERIAAWFEGTGCDAWLLHSEPEDAAAYALARINAINEDPKQAAGEFDEWLAYYDRERIEAIGFGLITLRRSTRSTNWFRCDRLPEVVTSCGEAITRGFASRDFLEANRDDGTLLAARLRPAADLRWELHHELSDNGWSAVDSLLRSTAGLGQVVRGEPSVIDLVARCTGSLKLGAYLEELAVSTGQEVESLAPGFLRVVRRLVELGYLLPVIDG